MWRLAVQVVSINFNAPTPTANPTPSTSTGASPSSSPTPGDSADSGSGSIDVLPSERTATLSPTDALQLSWIVSSDRRVVTVNLTVPRVAWIGVGVSASGTMLDTLAVLAFPSSIGGSACSASQEHITDRAVSGFTPVRGRRCSQRPPVRISEPQPSMRLPQLRFELDV